MTEPTPLSPAAQKVFNAYAAIRCRQEWSNVNDPPCHPEDSDWEGCKDCRNGPGIAAALRALEDQLAQDRAEPLPLDLERVVLTERIRLFRRITAIAAELEGQP